MTPTLQSLPRLTPPPELQSQLRVMASRHALRRRRFASLRAFATFVREETVLLFNNLARPYAVPCAGGLLSTLFLFGLVAPTFAVNRNIRADVPTAISTQASLEFALAFHLTGDDLGFDEIVVDVSTDEQGRVTGFTVPVGQPWAQDRALLRNLESTLLYTKFTPATFFGQPATGRTRITIRRNSVDVRG
jgi:hypothetical protein